MCLIVFVVMSYKRYTETYIGNTCMVYQVSPNQWYIAAYCAHVPRDIYIYIYNLFQLNSNYPCNDRQQSTTESPGSNTRYIFEGRGATIRHESRANYVNTRTHKYTYKRIRRTYTRTSAHARTNTRSVSCPRA